MVRTLPALVLALLLGMVPRAGAAEIAEVAYLEGLPWLRPLSGERMELDFGDVVTVGDSVITEQVDFVELEQADGITIQIAPNSIFTLQELAREGERRTVFGALLGEIAYRFERIVGREPELATPSSIAGVRGTELTVFVAPDGSAFYAVQKGAIEVAADGVAVSLQAGEAVETRPGEAPGEVFTWLGRELNYSAWESDRLARFLDDPAGAVERLHQRLNFFRTQIDDLYPRYLQAAEQLRALQAESDVIQAREGTEAAQRFARQQIQPLIQPTQLLILNTRYYALSALSLRRFLLGRLYIEMKSRYILRPQDSRYRTFLEAYQRLRADFERSIVPQLVVADI